MTTPTKATPPQASPVIWNKPVTPHRKGSELVSTFMGRVLKKTSSSGDGPLVPAHQFHDARLDALIAHERRRESAAEIEAQKVAPQAHGVVQRFAKLLHEEQERAIKTVNDLRVEAQEVSIASLLRLQRLRGLRRRKMSPSSHRESLAMFDDDARADLPPLREEVLMKQARDLKSWKPRYFVLRSEGLFFWETKEAFAASPTSALGKIMFVDFVLPNGSAADRVPNLVSRILSQQSHVFCCHKESTTYVLGCPSEESLRAWVQLINAAFEAFLVQQNQRTKLVEAALGVGSTEMYALATDLARTPAKADLMLKSMLAALADEFYDDVAVLRNHRVMRRVLEGWRHFARNARKRRRRQGSLAVA